MQSIFEMIKNHLDGLSHQAKLILPPIRDGWFLTQKLKDNIAAWKDKPIRVDLTCNRKP
ncbi:MAG: hypothetical protein QF632_05045 [Candidatus Woesearchaeota archaeon]|jgi:hypothetical protein|nr:hypothetical protein [Candidatus Woesearchaeota archaeon]MDP7324097.1 hypothetical protein [Candidatus Woesearchaeota archaeon]MDP7458006.1 hypothetical protein [Candidatus Woesearchaeota archaeon]